jgi:hypothetical protein
MKGREAAPSRSASALVVIETPESRMKFGVLFFLAAAFSLAGAARSAASVPPPSNRNSPDAPSPCPSYLTGRRAGCDSPAQKMGIIVPAYFYPADEGLPYWDALIQAASRVPIVAITNVAPTADQQADPNYLAVIQRAIQAGATVIGYIDTAYGVRPLYLVERDVDLAVRLYPGIQGIFFDEQSDTVWKANYYATLYRYVHSKMENPLVVNNPGTFCPRVYFDLPTADSTCVFETFGAFSDYFPPDWSLKLPDRRFTALPYAVASVEEMRRNLALAAQRGVGLIYVTDDGKDGNPWDRLPSYWEEEVSAIDAFNRASEGRVPSSATDGTRLRNP